VSFLMDITNSSRSISYKKIDFPTGYAHHIRYGLASPLHPATTPSGDRWDGVVKPYLTSGIDIVNRYYILYGGWIKVSGLASGSGEPIYIRNLEGS
jgi:hypothetical protein